MKLKLLPLLILVLIIIGCAPNTIVIMEGYKSLKLSGKTLAIAKFKPFILNPDDVVDDLGSGVAEDVYINYFSKTFSTYLKKHSTFDTVIYMSQDIGSKLTDRELSVTKKEMIRIALPTDGTTLRYDSLSTDYILFISQFSISRGAVQSGYFIPTPGGIGTYSGGSSGDLRHQIYFALWDNVDGKIISYGRTESVSSLILFTMTKSNWLDCINKNVKDIIKNTPFDK